MSTSAQRHIIFLQLRAMSRGRARSQCLVVVTPQVHHNHLGGRERGRAGGRGRAGERGPQDSEGHQGPQAPQTGLRGAQ